VRPELSRVLVQLARELPHFFVQLPLTLLCRGVKTMSPCESGAPVESFD